jgi:hypothetical protein
MLQRRFIQDLLVPTGTTGIVDGPSNETSTFVEHHDIRWTKGNNPSPGLESHGMSPAGSEIKQRLPRCLCVVRLTQACGPSGRRLGIGALTSTSSIWPCEVHGLA